MGMFGFLRKKKADVPEVGVEEISFGEIGSWIEKRERVLLEDERGIFVDVGERLKGFYVSVEEVLGILEGIDIEGKNEHERAKILVRQGLNNYVNSVRVLLKELGKIETNRLGEFAVEVVEVFNRFEKTSARFYSRANYLIGDEMAAVRNEVRRFYNELVESLEGSLIRDLKRVADVKLKLGEIEKVEGNFAGIEKEIGANDLGIDKARDLVRKLKKEVEEIRGSKEYISGMSAREEIVGLRVGIDKETQRLKELIDFKRLTNLVHSNEGEMRIVKDYKAHFLLEFSKDNGDRLFGLMAGTKMRSDEIRAKVDLIERRKIELDEKREGLGVDYTVAKLKEIDKIVEERESVELENIKGDRRMEELGLRLKGLKSEVVLLVEEFGVGVVIK